MSSARFGVTVEIKLDLRKGAKGVARAAAGLGLIFPQIHCVTPDMGCFAENIHDGPKTERLAFRKGR